MVPHVFGWFTMTSVWFILCVQLENAKRDIDEVSDNNIPEWVEATIYGSLLIFMNFAFVSCSASNLHNSPPPVPCSSLLSDGTTHSCPVLGRLKLSSNVALLHSNHPQPDPLAPRFLYSRFSLCSCRSLSRHVLGCVRASNPPNLNARARVHF
jgi:hypothetical protein